MKGNAKKGNAKPMLAAHLALALLVGIVIFVPNRRATTAGYGALLAGLAVIELLFLWHAAKNHRAGTREKGPYDIILFIWVLFILWEMVTSVLGLAHPVLVPAPENVFDTFRRQWQTMLLNVLYSMQLLLVGFFAGLAAAVVLGLYAGWMPRLRGFACPIANVMAPIPPVVFSPYLVALMPSFRSASVLVVVLGVFWPNFLATVNRVAAVDPRILDSARMLNLSDGGMVWKVLFPSILPGVVAGMRVSMTTSLLMLNFAELMGATHGMGYYVQNSITYANYAHAVAGMLVIGVVVTVLNQILSKIQPRVIKWQ